METKGINENHAFYIFLVDNHLQKIMKNIKYMHLCLDFTLRP